MGFACPIRDVLGFNGGWGYSRRQSGLVRRRIGLGKLVKHVGESVGRPEDAIR